MRSVTKTPDIASLLAETCAALAHLRMEELESLAQRAEAILTSKAEMSLSTVAARREHRLLGDLLDATDENLRVLRRVNCGEGSARWVR